MTRRQLGSPDRGVLAAIAVGAVLGAEARYGLSLWLPHGSGEFPWSTLIVNVSGCALMGVLMGCLRELGAAPRLIGPFLGTGVLGGYTTFSTYTVEIQQLLLAGRWATALGYLMATVAAALLAVWAAMAITAWLTTHRPGREPSG